MGTSSTVRVRDVMTSEPITFAASTSIADAARSLSFHHVSGVPVIDQGRIVGVLSKTNSSTPATRPLPRSPRR